MTETETLTCQSCFADVEPASAIRVIQIKTMLGGWVWRRWTPSLSYHLPAWIRGEEMHMCHACIGHLGL